MSIKLKLFSSLMEYLPAGSVGNTVEIPAGAPLTCNQLIERYKIPRESVQVVMLNGEYLAPERRDETLSPEDTVSIWPSIQGG